MAKPVTLRWKARRQAPSPKAVAGLLAVLALMGSPWLVLPLLERAPGGDTHVVSLKPEGDGWAARVGKERLELHFIHDAGETRARVTLVGVDGTSRVTPTGARVHLEVPAPNGRRARVEFAPVAAAFVSTRPLASLPDRSVLVLDEGDFRHTFALDARSSVP